MSSQVNFISKSFHHKLKVCLKGLQSLCHKHPPFLTLGEEQLLLVGKIEETAHRKDIPGQRQVQQMPQRATLQYTVVGLADNWLQSIIVRPKLFISPPCSSVKLVSK